MTDTKLKPCPFCGGEAHIRDDVSHSTAYFIGCDNDDRDCFGAIHWAETRSEAIAGWNTRADLLDMDVLTRVEAKLSAVLEACDRAKMHPRPGCGAGGMTIEANIRGSVYSGVDAWPVEEARDAHDDLRAMMEKINE